MGENNTNVRKNQPYIGPKETTRDRGSTSVDDHGQDPETIDYVPVHVIADRQRDEQGQAIMRLVSGML